MGRVGCLVVDIHGGWEAVPLHVLDCFDRAGQTLLQLRAFLQGKTAEYMSGRGTWLRLVTNTNPQARNTIGAEVLDH
jgi:hypothetical protein